MTSPLFCARHYHGGQVALVEPCPWCRIEQLETMLSAANATHDLTLSVAKEAMDRIEEREATIARINRRAQAAESAARENVEACRRQGASFGRGLANWYAAKMREERDAARAVARVLAHAWRHDSRPPDEVVREAEAYPVGESEKQTPEKSVDSSEGGK